MIEIKSIIMFSIRDPATLLAWCGTCGRSARLSQDFPVAWYERIIRKM
ncbi:MAG: hypothetical protein HY913_15720 [Desulfomonile tiedjei]|nr:hypothetical protein [Desulfomonile tiedjei]